MGLYENWPYSNFHEYNQQWMIAVCRRAVDTMDALSETINGIVDDRFQEFTDLINQFKIDFAAETAKLNKQVNDAVAAMDAATKQMQADFTALENDVNSRMAQLEAELNAKIQAALDEYGKAIAAQLKWLQQQIDDLLQSNDRWKKEWELWVRQYIDAKLAEFEASLPDVQQVLVISPVSGKLMTITDALAEMYDAMKFLSLAAEEYDALNLSAEEYDHYMIHSLPQGLTAYQYDFLGMLYLVIYRQQANYMIHPWTGESVPMADIVNFNTAMIRQSGAFTAQDYDSLDLLSETYDGYNLSSNDYDWRGALLIAQKEVTA